MFPAYFFTFFLLLSVVYETECAFEDARCQCICPSVSVIDVNSTSSRRLYTNITAPSECTAEKVVAPYLKDKYTAEQLNKYYLRCECKFQTRNTTMNKVVILLVMCIICILVLYMLFLLCLEPVLRRKRAASVPYQQQFDDQDENIFHQGTTSMDGSMEEEGSSAPAGRIADNLHKRRTESVLDKVEHQRSKWMHSVQEQRKNIFDEHTMLN